MTTVQQLEQEIQQIKARNARVETDKAWETSKTRKALILVLTYIVIAVFFATLKLPDPLINALVPAIAFMLSTATIPIIKKWWVTIVYKK